MRRSDQLAALEGYGNLSAEPPDVPNRYQQAPVEKVPMLDATDELEQLTGLAMSKLREILEEPLDPDSARLMQAQLSAANTVVNLQVKVDEGRLRRKKTDILPKLIELLNNEEAKLGARMLAGSLVASELAG